MLHLLMLVIQSLGELRSLSIQFRQLRFATLTRLLQHIAAQTWVIRDAANLVDHGRLDISRWQRG